jgi:hypothetical protein
MQAIMATLGANAAVFDATRQCLVHEGRNVSGLCRVLSALFYPDYVHKGTRPRKGAPRQPVVTKRRGIQVHRQLDEWRLTGRVPRDDLSRNIAEALARQRISLTQCEVPILYKAANVGTMVDALGTDPNGRTVVLEFKAGYQRRVRGQDHLRLVTRTKVPSVPKNHALLQLAMTRAILREQYGITADQYLLVISNGKGVELRSLPEWTNEIEATMLMKRYS